MIINFVKSIAGSRIRRYSLVSVGIGLLGQALLVVTGVLSARMLGVENRGNLAFIVAISAFVSMLGGLGLPQSITYYVSAGYQAISILKKVNILLCFQLIGIILLNLVIVLFFVNNGKIVSNNVAIISMASAPGTFFLLIGLAVLQGLGFLFKFSFLRVMQIGLYAIFIVVLYLTGLTELIFLVLAWGLSNLFAGVIIFGWSVISAQKNAKQKIEKVLLGKEQFLLFGIKGLIGYASPIDNFRLDHIIAGILLPANALGLYVVGQAFTNLMKIISQSVGMIAYPVISRTNEFHRSWRLSINFVLFVFIIDSILLFFLWPFIPVLIRFFFGLSFIGATPIAKILLVAAFFVSIRRILVECLRGLGKPEISSYAELSLYPILILSILLFVPQYGIKGLAIAVAIGQFLALIIAAALFWRYKLKFHQT